MSDTLTELKRLHAEATGGPWKVTGELGIEGQADSSTDFDPLVIGGLKGGKGLIQFPSYSLYSQPTRTQGKANAALIVAAVNAFPKLLACVEALEKVLPDVESLAETVGYGYARPSNPHDFSPDHECCTEDEIAAHKAACEAYDRGEYDPASTPGSLSAPGLHLLRAPWGIGSYTVRDEATWAIVEQARAALASLKGGA